MFILESKVQVPVQSAVFIYGRQDTSDRSKVISRQENIFLGKRYNEIWMSQIARLMRPIWGPPWADRTQVGPMLAPWTLLSGWSRRVYIIPWYHNINYLYCTKLLLGTRYSIRIICVFLLNDFIVSRLRLEFLHSVYIVLYMLYITLSICGLLRILIFGEYKSRSMLFFYDFQANVRTGLIACALSCLEDSGCVWFQFISAVSCTKLHIINV